MKNHWDDREEKIFSCCVWVRLFIFSLCFGMSCSECCWLCMLYGCGCANIVVVFFCVDGEKTNTVFKFMFEFFSFLRWFFFASDFFSMRSFDQLFPISLIQESRENEIECEHTERKTTAFKLKIWERRCVVGVHAFSKTPLAVRKLHWKMLIFPAARRRFE